MFLPWIPNVERYHTVKIERRQVELAIAENQNLAAELHELSDGLSAAKTELHDATSRNEKAYKKLKKLHGELDLDSQKYLKAEETEGVYLNRIERLEKTIQEIDKYMIEEQ